MYLHVEPAGDRAVELVEADDFTSLKVVVAGPEDWAALAEALGASAEVDVPHVWIGIAALTDLAGRPDDAAWHEGFAAMLAYAEKHGWVDEGGSSVRVHCEWAS